MATAKPTMSRSMKTSKDYAKLCETQKKEIAHMKSHIQEMGSCIRETRKSTNMAISVINNVMAMYELQQKELAALKAHTTQCNENIIFRLQMLEIQSSVVPNPDLL
jgi:hypothetical protein